MELYVRVRRACIVDGMSYVRGCPEFELRWDAVRKMFQYSANPAYRRGSLPRRPKLDPDRGVTGYAKRT